jgi:hypothetical protein
MCLIHLDEKPTIGESASSTPYARHDDFSSEWKVPHWKSENTGASFGTNLRDSSHHSDWSIQILPAP